MTRILVVDDEPQILRSLRTTLSANGCRLWAEQSAGAGAAFTLALPSAAARPTLVR